MLLSKFEEDNLSKLIDFYLYEREIIFYENSDLSDFELKVLTRLSVLFTIEECKYLLTGLSSAYGLECINLAANLGVESTIKPLSKHIAKINKKVLDILYNE